MHHSLPLFHALDRRLPARRLLLAAAAGVACTLGVLRDVAWAAFPDRTGLVSYWTMDEEDGARADSFGANSLADNGSLVGANAKIYRGGDFVRASTQYLSCADNASLSAGAASWTIAAWVKLDLTPSGQMTIVSKSTGTATTSEYSVQWTSATSRFSMTISKGSGDATVTANNFGNVLTGTWYYVVAWHDADNQEIGISVNGVANVASHSVGANDTTEAFRIGASSGGTANAFDGLIDEVSFWKRVLTSEERAALYNGGRGAWHPGLGGYVLDGADGNDATAMEHNVISLRNWAASNGAWLTDLDPLNLKADLYFFDERVEWATRSGLPTVQGSGGEPIYHPLTQYGENPAARGGPVTAMVWGGTDYTTSMWDVYGHGWVIDGVHFMGKQGATNAELLEDGDGEEYPYANPLEAHPHEDRCRYAIRVRSTEDFGSGKGVFPRGLATHLFQVGILADDNPAFSNHNDQCHVMGRFAPAWCDVGYWSKQRQAFSWHFGQIESTATWTILLDAGGKLVIDELDMQTRCLVGLFVRGSDFHQGVGPDETRINYINIDETAPNNCLLVKTDSNHTGMYDPMTGEITTDVIHSVKKNEIVRVTWGSGQQRTGMKVTAVDDTTITIADNPTPPPTASGNTLPGSPTEMTVVRYSATSTIIGAAHVHGDRASQSRGDAIYSATGADFNSSTRVISQPSNTNLAPLANGDYVEFYDQMSATPTYPIFVGKIASFSDGADTITLTTDEFFRTMPSSLTDRVKVVVYRPSLEKPIFSFKNTYGYPGSTISDAATAAWCTPKGEPPRIRCGPSLTASCSAGSPRMQMALRLDQRGCLTRTA